MQCTFKEEQIIPKGGAWGSLCKTNFYNNENCNQTFDSLPHPQRPQHFSSNRDTAIFQEASGKQVRTHICNKQKNKCITAEKQMPFNEGNTFTVLVFAGVSKELDSL